MKGIGGITEMKIEHRAGAATMIDVRFVAERNYNPDELIHADWGDLFPGNSIVKCRHCGQWAARKTECKHCGAPVE